MASSSDGSISPNHERSFAMHAPVRGTYAGPHPWWTFTSASAMTCFQKGLSAPSCSKNKPYIVRIFVARKLVSTRITASSSIWSFRRVDKINILHLCLCEKEIWPDPPELKEKDRAIMVRGTWQRCSSAMSHHGELRDQVEYMANQVCWH
jgi:hypothetical protein